MCTQATALWGLQRLPSGWGRLAGPSSPRARAGRTHCAAGRSWTSRRCCSGRRHRWTRSKGEQPAHRNTALQGRSCVKATLPSLAQLQPWPCYLSPADKHAAGALQPLGLSPSVCPPGWAATRHGPSLGPPPLPQPLASESASGGRAGPLDMRDSMGPINSFDAGHRTA